MKKIVHTPSQPERKVVAVLGSAENGYYRKDNSDKVWWIGPDGCYEKVVLSWESLLRRTQTKVYEGDSITITF